MRDRTAFVLGFWFVSARLRLSPGLALALVELTPVFWHHRLTRRGARGNYGSSVPARLVLLVLVLLVLVPARTR